MTILLIRPRPHKETIGLQSVMVCEPLELMQLAAVLRYNGHTVSLLDCILDCRPIRSVLRDVAPQLVCLTGYISHIGVMKEIAAQIKRWNSDICVTVGGVHAAVCPWDFDDPAIDLVCRSANELYDYLDCKNREVLPDREITAPYQAHYYYLFQNKCALIKTSFGCPYSCNFCFCKEVSPYSARPIDTVIEELLEIPQQEVYIVDDDFLFNRDRLLKFCEKVQRHKIHKHYLVYGRADFIAQNEDVICQMKEVGLSAVIVGIEAASQQELDRYNKKSDVGQNIQAIRILQKYDIECYATVILGVDWNKEDFRNLYRFIRENNLTFVNLQPFTPMPGTEYFEEYRQHLLIPYQEHEKWDMAHLVVQPTGMSVRQYYWQILSLYYKITMRPRNIAYMFRKYGVICTTKLSVGALQITLQYLKKIIRG